MGEADTKQLKKNAIKELEKFLDELDCDNEKDHKRCRLISYWVKDYIKFLRQEKTFLPHKARSYKRGDVIKVDFGFRIGHEFGGLHYAVVLSKHTPKRSGTLVVAPLKSKKEDKKIRKTEVDLGDELFRALVSKRDTTNNEIQQEISRIEKEIENLKELNGNEEKINQKLKVLDNDIENFKIRLMPFKAMEDELLRMKVGSIADVGQICTISKIRIYDPTHSGHPLAGIKISPTTLGIIDEKVKELLIY